MKLSPTFKQFQFTVDFSKIESKGSIMKIKAQKLEVKNVNVDNLMSKEAAILSMTVDQPTNPAMLGLNSNNDLHVLTIQNCTFTNIISYSGSILFEIDLNKIRTAQMAAQINMVLNFDKLTVKNVFSYKSGPIFNIKNMKKEKIVIQNSEFRSFKGGLEEQLIQFFGNSHYEYNYDKQNYKLMLNTLANYSTFI